jgi:hypothetical protein
MSRTNRFEFGRTDNPLIEYQLCNRDRLPFKRHHFLRLEKMPVTIDFEDNAIIHRLLDQNYLVTQQYAHDAKT